jgi:cytochrome c oxidase subunit 2
MSCLSVLAQLRAYYDRDPSMWSTASSDARRLAALGTSMTVVGALVFAGVVVILAMALRRRRGSTADLPDPEPAVSETRWVVGGGLVLPVVVLAGIFIATLSTLRAFASTDDPAAPDVVVTGHQWWWEVRYPRTGAVTANEIHIPVGRRLRVELRSADVIHSLWIPNLEGKTDLVPGHRNYMTLRADSSGVYVAECAEFCGMQHAHMRLSVVAQDPALYARWMESERQAAGAPGDPVAAAGQLAFMNHSCAFCHTVRGTPAGGLAGPDLTHVGSRLTLAAGTLPNSTGNLAGWISNPDRIKPGTRMPAIALDGATLQAIVHYLETLK